MNQYFILTTIVEFIILYLGFSSLHSLYKKRKPKSFYTLHARGMLELNETEAFAVHQVAYSSAQEARDEIGEFYRKITEPSERTTDCFHPQSLEFCIMEIKTK